MTESIILLKESTAIREFSLLISVISFIHLMQSSTKLNHVAQKMLTWTSSVMLVESFRINIKAYII